MGENTMQHCIMPLSDLIPTDLCNKLALCNYKTAKRYAAQTAQWKIEDSYFDNR